MPRRYLLLSLSLIAAAVCIRLGFWQLARLAQKRAINVVRADRLSQPAVDLAALPADTAESRYRQVHARGRFDYGREYALASRPREGSPGAYLLTPLIRPGTDTLVLVVRGWVYAADGTTVDFGRWREADSAAFVAYVLPFPPVTEGVDSSARVRRAVRRLDHARLSRRMGTAVAEYYLVMTSGVAKGDSIPNRLPMPALDEGPHLSYAVQWFLFAVIFGAGGTVVVLLGRRVPPEGGHQ